MGADPEMAAIEEFGVCVGCGAPTPKRKESMMDRAWAAYEAGRITEPPTPHYERCLDCYGKRYGDEARREWWSGVLNQSRRPSRVRKDWICEHCHTDIPKGSVAYVCRSEWEYPWTASAMTWRFCTDDCGKGHRPGMGTAQADLRGARPRPRPDALR